MALSQALKLLRNSHISNCTLTHKACYRKAAGGKYAGHQRKTAKQELLEDGVLTEGDPLGFEASEQLEALEDFASQENGDFMQDFSRRDRATRQKIAYSTIQRKHFKPPQELNLLTWDAKEQIRYLNFEFPDEWTVDRLAESFPISRDGVIKLLKSTRTVRSVQEVIKHDRTAQRHWKQIMAGNTSNLPESVIRNLPSAAGNKSLPTPNQDLLLESISMKALPPKQPGLFESMAIKHVEYLKSNTVGTHSGKPNSNKVAALKLPSEITIKPTSPLEKLNKTRMQSAKLLADDSKQQQQQSQGSSVKKLKQEYSKAFSAKSNEADTTSKKPVRRNLLESIHDQMTLVDAIENGLETRSAHAELSSRQSTTSNCNDNDPGMSDTGRIKSTSVVESEPDYGGEFEERSKYSVEARTREILNKIKFEKSASTEGGNADAYLYDDNTGYQYPLGKTGKYKERINVPPHHDASQTDAQKVYRQGNCFYNEKGEFLYKI